MSTESKLGRFYALLVRFLVLIVVQPSTEMGTFISNCWKNVKNAWKKWNFFEIVAWKVSKSTWMEFGEFSCCKYIWVGDFWNHFRLFFLLFWSNFNEKKTFPGWYWIACQTKLVQICWRFRSSASNSCSHRFGWFFDLLISIEDRI